MHAEILCGPGSIAVPQSGALKVGRAIDSDVRLFDDVRVSRLHCKIWIDNDRLAVQDCGSANGTSVNGYEIDEAVQLQDGDRIKVGETELIARVLEGKPRIEGSTTHSATRSRIASKDRDPK